MQPRGREGRGPLANAEIMIATRRIEVCHQSERLNGRASLGRQRQGRMQEQTSIAETEHRHRGGEPHAEDTDRAEVHPNTVCKRSHASSRLKLFALARAPSVNSRCLRPSVRPTKTHTPAIGMVSTAIAVRLAPTTWMPMKAQAPRQSPRR